MIKKKRNRTKNTTNTKKEDSVDLSGLEDEDIENRNPKVNEVFKLNKMKMYLYHVLYKKLYLAERDLPFGDLWDMIDKDENNKDIKSKDDLDQVLKHLRDEKKIKYLETEVIRLIL